MFYPRPNTLQYPSYIQTTCVLGKPATPYRVQSLNSSTTELVLAVLVVLLALLDLVVALVLLLCILVLLAVLGSVVAVALKAVLAAGVITVQGTDGVLPVLALLILDTQDRNSAEHAMIKDVGIGIDIKEIESQCRKWSVGVYTNVALLVDACTHADSTCALCKILGTCR